MPLPKLFIGAAGVAAGAVLLCNIAPWMVAKPRMATLEYLKAGKLQTLDGQNKTFMVSARKLQRLNFVHFLSIIFLSVLKVYIMFNRNWVSRRIITPKSNIFIYWENSYLKVFLIWRYSRCWVTTLSSYVIILSCHLIFTLLLTMQVTILVIIIQLEFN